jgi:hypothetical protein
MTAFGGEQVILDCPICCAQAQNLTPPTYGGLVIGCDRCGTYRIMKSAVPAVRKLKAEKRLDALKRAKTLISSRGWPTINSGCF